MLDNKKFTPPNEIKKSDASFHANAMNGARNEPEDLERMHQQEESLAEEQVMDLVKTANKETAEQALQSLIKLFPHSTNKQLWEQKIKDLK